MRKTNLKNWNLWRVTRIALGLLFIVKGFLITDYSLMAAGIFLAVHALINYCQRCGSQVCELSKETNHGKI